MTWYSKNSLHQRIKPTYLKRVVVFLIPSIGCGILITAIVFFIIARATDHLIYDDIESLPHTQIALIPGASVSKEGVLSPVLKDRADAAIAVYRAGKVDKIVVSGDNSTTTYNEVNPIKNYLLYFGIPEEDVFLDYAGFDTYSSMYRARDIFLVGSTTVISQSFHLPRAVYIGQHLGIATYGFNADDGHYLYKNYVREWLANIKAVINLALHTKPKYLGKKVPVTGTQ